MSGIYNNISNCSNFMLNFRNEATENAVKDNTRYTRISLTYEAVAPSIGDEYDDVSLERK